MADEVPVPVFRLLGPVEVLTRPGVPVRFARRQHRDLLGFLLLEANRMVGVAEIVDAIWAEAPPATVAEQILNMISAVRAVLRRDASEAASLERLPDGYRLRADPELIDLGAVEELAARATKAHTAKERANLLSTALELWRGVPLAGIGAPYAQTARPRLEARRAAIEEDLFDAELDAGHDREIIDRLTAALARQPMRERLAGQLMTAHYRAGRQADALEVYQQVSRTLAAELGLDPGNELRRIHGAIIRGDPIRPATAVVPVLPAQLPASLATFTGRAAELDQLLAASPGAGAGGGPAVVIHAIEGMAGIGKTALAVHAAHHFAARYPDGQLFIDLHGFTPGMVPLSAAEALDRMLRSLGVPGPQIPSDVDTRAALYRSVIAGKRILAVLDNAATESQVQHLIPGTPDCLVLITSRRRLTDLDDVDRISLGPLPARDALAMFRRIAGSHQPTDVASEIIVLCGRLPLAIRLAAARLRSRPTWTAHDLADRLRRRGRRLAELAAGQRSVAAALDLSYRHLTPEQQRCYRLLGLIPGADFDAYSAAAVTDRDLDRAAALLDGLTDVHLIQESAPNRYRFHDLIRAHAAAAAGAEREQVRHDAVTRLLDLYTRAAGTAVGSLYPHFKPWLPELPPSGTPLPSLEAPIAAKQWLDAEVANVLAAAELAAERGWSDHALKISAFLRWFLRRRGHWSAARRLHRSALGVAEERGDDIALVDALVGLGGIHLMTSENTAAGKVLRQALAISRRIGYHHGAVGARLGLGHIHLNAGAFARAGSEFRRALSLAGQIGDRVDEYSALAGLGDIHLWDGQHAAAEEVHRRALSLARELDYGEGELNSLRGLGWALQAGGHHAEARNYLQQALLMARETRSRIGELAALRGLADVHRSTGQLAAADAGYREILTISTDLGYHNGRLEALLGLGATCLGAGQSAQARQHYQTALDLAVQLGQRHDQARAHDGLGATYLDLGDSALARWHWQHALDVHISLGAPEVESIRTNLENLPVDDA